MLVSAAIIVSLVICVALVEWIRITSAPFNGFKDYDWIPRARTFFYLMAMFNILLIRYVIMRIYIAPGSVDFRSVVNRLSKAGIVSMLISELPCIYGLMLFLLAGDHIDFYLLFGLTVIYCAIYFPRHKSWVSVIEENTV